MKIGVISDIHGNLSALEAVIAELKKEGIKHIINAGDIVGYSPFPNECLELLRKEGIQSVIGNTDSAIANNQSLWDCIDREDKNSRYKILLLRWTQRHTSNANKKYLSSLSKHLKIEMNGHRIFVMHGGLDQIDERIHSYDSLAFHHIADTLMSDIVIMGHTLRPFVLNLKGKLFVNPGSVGQPEDSDPRPCYSVIDLDEKRAFIVRAPYNVMRVRQSVWDTKLPIELVDDLRSGNRIFG